MATVNYIVRRCMKRQGQALLVGRIIAIDDRDLTDEDRFSIRAGRLVARIPKVKVPASQGGK